MLRDDEVVRAISVDRFKQGRIQASSVPSRFDKIKNKFTWNSGLQPDPSNSSDDEADNYASKSTPIKYSPNAKKLDQRTITDKSDQQLLVHDETAATATLSCHGEGEGEIHPYPANWVKDPGRPTSNLFANKLNRIISSRCA